MNENTNTTAPAGSATSQLYAAWWKTATTPIEKLVAAHIEAVSTHSLAFDLKGWKIIKDGEIGDTIGLVDDAIIALCTARPSTSEDATLKREYLNRELFPVLQGNEEMTKRVVEALLNAASEPQATLSAEADRPTNLKGLMAALSVELMRWNGGGHRAVIYPADNEQQSSLQDLLLMPEEPGTRPSLTSMVARKIATAQDSLLEAHLLNVAVMLATEDLPDSAAIQAVARAVEAKLNLARDQLESLREALS